MSVDLDQDAPGWLCGHGPHDTFAALPLVGEQVFTYLRCRTCGLSRLANGDAERDLRSFYASEYEPVCGDFVTGQQSLLSRIRSANYRLMARRIERRVGRGRILDVGCGAGVFLATMRRQGWEVTGLEPNEEYVRGLRSEHQFDVRAGRLEDLPTTELDRYDALSLLDVVEHLPDPLGALEKARQLVRPGGVLLLTTPNAQSWEHRVFGRRWFALQPPDHLWLFSPASLKQLVTQAGFVSVSLEQSPVSYAWPSLRRLMRVRALPEPVETAAKAVMGTSMGAAGFLQGAPANLELYAVRPS